MKIIPKKIADTFTYSLPDYLNAYGTEKQCFQILSELKWPEGFQCSKCGHRHAYIIKKGTRFMMQCNGCHYQESAIVGTIMENTKLPLDRWFLAFYFVAQNKDGISSIALAKYIGVTLKSSWGMLQKIRESMSTREDEYKLSGIVEMDEAYIGAKDIDGKRGRGADKIKVSVAVQVSAEGHPIFAKMQVIPNVQGETLKAVAFENIVKGSTILSDGYRSYNALIPDYDLHSEKISGNSNNDYLKRLHVVISNVKAVIHGTHHGLKEDYIQRYLDEFCYRFNRRHCKSPIVDRLIKCAVRSDYKRMADLCI